MTPRSYYYNFWNQNSRLQLQEDSYIAYRDMFSKFVALPINAQGL